MSAKDTKQMFEMKWPIFFFIEKRDNLFTIAGCVSPGFREEVEEDITK